MNPPLTQDHWTVISIEKDRIVLSGGDKAATIKQLQEYGRSAMIRIDEDIRRFLYLPESGNAYVADLTVLAENDTLVITHGSEPHEQDRVRAVRDAFVHRTDDEILGKRVEFYKLVHKKHSLD